MAERKRDGGKGKQEAAELGTGLQVTGRVSSLSYHPKRWMLFVGVTVGADWSSVSPQRQRGRMRDNDGADQ